MSDVQNNKKLFLLMLPTSIFWSGAFIAGKIAVTEFTPFTLTFFRFFFALIIIFPLMLMKEKSNWKLNKKDIPIIFFMGFIGIFAYHVLFFISLKYTTAINASLIGATNPMVTSIFASIILGESLGLKRIGAILLAFSGVLLTISKGSFDIFRTLSFNFGDILMFTAVFCFAVYSVLSKKIMYKHSPIKILCYSFLFGLIILIPFIIIENPLTYISSVTFKGWFSVLYMAIFASAVGYLLQQISIKSYGASKTMLFVNLVPIFSILLSAIILNEKASFINLISGGIIICGVVINSRIKGKA